MYYQINCGVYKFCKKSLVRDSSSKPGPENKKSIDMLSHFEKFEEKDIVKRH